jgi:hypothetical protein
MKRSYRDLDKLRKKAKHDRVLILSSINCCLLGVGYDSHKRRMDGNAKVMTKPEFKVARILE